MDTDSLYLALAQQSLEDCIKPEMRETWINVRKDDCSNNFSANSSSNFFPRTCCNERNISSMISENLDFSKRNFVALILFVCAVKIIAASIRKQKRSSLVAKVSTKELWRKLAQNHWKNTEEFLRKKTC